MMAKETDVVVIGGGPGGYPAAIRATQLGKSVILVERDEIGGECLNVGCIPSKALLSATRLYSRILDEAPEMGIISGRVSLDLEKMQEWRRKVQENLVSGVKRLLKANGVEVLNGSAKLEAPGKVAVRLADDTTETISAKDVVIATGASYKLPDELVYDFDKVMTPYQAIDFKEIPDRVLVIGAGNIGIEFSTLMNRLGSNVILIDIGPDLFSDLDPRITAMVKRSLKKSGVDLRVATRLVDIAEAENGELIVTLESKDEGKYQLNCDRVIHTIGKQPNTRGLGLNEIGIDTREDGSIVVDDTMQTSLTHHYAVGDCTGAPYLAHRATKQGTISAEVIAGLPSEYDYRGVPRVIFSEPEIAFVGMSEQEAKDAGYEVVTGQASFAASGRAMTEDEAEGMVKIIAEASTGAVIGVQLVGPEATDLVSEMSLAIEMGALLEDLSFTIHPHPTLPEMLMEAAASAQGKAINIANARHTVSR